MDPEIIKWFSTLGVGGIIAAFAIYLYHKDFGDAKVREDRLAEALENHAKASEAVAQSLIQVVNSVTKAQEDHRNDMRMLLNQFLDKKGI